MAEYAPKAIFGLFDEVNRLIPAVVLSGILGDASHTFGYHRCRHALPGNDYSVTLPKDKLGDTYAAAALDLSFNPTLMKTVTGRLLAAAKAHDSRLHALREFCGTTNGTVTHNYDLSNGHEGFGEWDNSHLWHVHLSLYRQYTNDPAALLPIASVIAGRGAPSVPVPKPTPAGPHLRRAWPGYMQAGNYFGLITGPNTSHGGFTAAERPDVKAIQQRLQTLKFAPGTAGWADGKFEQPTKDAVAKWQHAHRPGTTLYGQVWHDDWNTLFTY